MQYFRLFGQYHLFNSRVVVISANLSLSRAICEWNEYKLCADIVNRGNGYETRQSSLLYVFVLFFGLDPAQNTIVVYSVLRN